MIFKFFHFFLSFLIISSSYAFSEAPRFYIVDNLELETSDLPRRSMGDDLFVSVDGKEYLITNEILQNYYFKSIFAEKDLDGDGRDEVILEIHNGSNCCGSEYVVVAHLGETFFSVIQHDVFNGAGFPSLNLVDKKGEKLIQVVNMSEGAENTSQTVSISLLRFEYGQLTLLSQNENASIIPSIVEVNSFEFDKDNPMQIVREFDGDGDDIADKLICDYWPRWGSTVCDIDSSVFGYQDFSFGCKRFGVLKSSSNGLSDLVCNYLSVLRFDGSAYFQDGRF